MFRIFIFSDVITLLCNAFFYSAMAKGKRKHGDQYLRYKDVFKRYLNAGNIDYTCWEDLS